MIEFGLFLLLGGAGVAALIVARMRISRKLREADSDWLFK